MPTYEYVCTDCKNEWEEIQKISEDALKVCPKCGHDTAKRQISAGNFILKGGGWYADLYSSSKKPETKSEGSGSGKPVDAAKPAASESKSEAAAPAAKTETASTSTSSGGGSGSSSSGST